MTTLAAVVLIVGDEASEGCLSSLSRLDEICVLTDNPRVSDSARRLGAASRLIPRPPYLEAIGEELLSTSTSEWLLLIDPDERLICADHEMLRSALSGSGSDVAGYSIAYRFRFLDHPLRRTYEGLRKTKLVRPRNVQWPTTIHSLPTPSPPEGRFLSLPESIAYIETDLLGDVSSRLARHARWASIEATASPEQPVDTRRIVQALTRSLEEYFSERSCLADGNAGFLNGLLHLNKSIASLLFEAAIRGLKDECPERVQLLGTLFRDAASTLTAGMREIP